MAIVHKPKAEGKFLKPPCYTQAHLRNVSICWEPSMEPDQTSTLILSPMYEIDDINWQIALCTNCEDGDDDMEKYLSAYVTMSSPECNILANFNLALTDHQSVYKKCTGIRQFTKTSPCIGFPKYIPMSQIMKEETLTVWLEMTTWDIERLDDNGYVSSKPEKVNGNIPQSLDIVNNNNFSPSPHANDGLVLDKAIFIGMSALPVDSKRMSVHSSVLRDFFQAPDQMNAIYDISSMCRNKNVMRIVIDFCHSGTFALPLPNMSDSVFELLDVAKYLNMAGLQKEIENEVFKTLSPQTFASAVELCTSEYIMDPDRAQNILAKYMIEHFDELQGNEHYEATFNFNLKLYTGILLKRISRDDESDNADTLLESMEIIE